jgi:hypothetical protein
MDVNQNTLPELQPIFTFLNSHSNKLYQEGYFLKLDDQNTRMYERILEGPFSKNNLQREKPMPTERGRNASHNLWGRSCRCGTQQNWMRLAKMARFCPSSSI